MEKSIEKIMELLGDANTPVAVATVSENEPKVRFLSFKMVENGKIYFLTGKSKSVYKELEKNNNIEICSMPNPDRQWVRLKGQAKFVRDIALNQKAFEILPILEKAYQTPENEDIALFYMENLSAMKFSIGSKPEVL